MVFSQPQLQQFCSLLPTTTEAFRLMEGVGGEKLLMYGAKFTQAIREFVESHPEIMRLKELVTAPSASTAGKKRKMDGTLQPSKPIDRGRGAH